jgi:hypothetical protein
MIPEMTSVFPLVKRFQDMKSKNTTVFLNEETSIHGKCFREGTVFTIVGWREMNEKPFLILSKGSWEGMVSYENFSTKLESIHGK